MPIFVAHMHETRYFEAINIVRNKITKSASESLTNYNTVFNFDAIISRLDFTYADKRPIYIIEQEMIVLKQRSLSIEDFYDSANKKLNALINKINMTHKERSVACAMEWCKMHQKKRCVHLSADSGGISDAYCIHQIHQLCQMHMRRFKLLAMIKREFGLHINLIGHNMLAMMHQSSIQILNLNQRCHINNLHQFKIIGMIHQCGIINPNRTYGRGGTVCTSHYYYRTKVGRIANLCYTYHGFRTYSIANIFYTSQKCDV